MRDLTVDNTHTYYVIAADTPVLVHNNDTDECPIPGLIVPSKSIVTPTAVYRGDRRSPDTIVSDGGFMSRGTNTDLMDYVINDTSSAWVGTSSKERVAAAFPYGQRGVARWVYEIQNPGVGVDVNRALGWRFRMFNDNAKEHEIVFPQIDLSTIVRARQFQLGQPTGQVWVNPEFQ